MQKTSENGKWKMQRMRLKLLEMLKGIENEKLKDFVDKSVINNDQVSLDVTKIIEKLDDRFGVSQEIKDKIAREELYNMKCSGSTSDILDKMERMRRKVLSSLSAGTDQSFTISFLDKFILQDFLEKMK